MSRLLLLWPSFLRHHAVVFFKPGGRHIHSKGPRHRALSPTESAIGLTVFYMTFYIPAGYVLSHLREFRRE